MVQIDSGKGVVTLINVFTVNPVNQQKLVDLLAEATRTTMRHLPGFVSETIHKSADGTRVASYAQWRRTQDYEAMLRDPQAMRHIDPVRRLAAGDAHLYEVVDTFAPEIHPVS